MQSEGSLGARRLGEGYGLGRWKSCGLFVPYYDVRWDEKRSDSGAFAAVVDYMRSLSVTKTYKGLFLYGPPGTGKTLLAHMVLDWVLAKRHPEARIRAITAVEYMRLVQTEITTSSMGTGAASEWVAAHETLEEYDTARWLLVDDMATEHPTEWSRNRLNLLIRSRGNKGYPTIMTSNMNLDDFADHYGKPTESYLHQTCEIIEVHGDDERKR